MCRLVAYAGPTLSLDTLVFGGDHSLYRQSWAPRELLSGSVNADGYGVAWYNADRVSRLVDPRPIWHEGELEGTLGALDSEMAIASLRNGTPGLPVDRSSLIPMTHDRWTFVLNGFVPSFRSRYMRRLRSRLPDELYAELTGVSDTETLFLLTVAKLREGATSLEALQSTVAAVAAEAVDEEAQLNMVLSDGATVCALRTATATREGAPTNSLYLAEAPKVTAKGVVLASEPLDTSEAWRTVPPHSWVDFGRDGQVTTGTLGP